MNDVLGPPLFTEPVVVANRVRGHPLAYLLLDHRGTKMLGRTYLLHRFVPGAAIEMEIHDFRGQVLLRVSRPRASGEAAVYVRDPQRRDIGRIVRSAPAYPGADISGTFDGLAGTVATFAAEDSSLVAVLDTRGELVASLSQGSTGLADTASPTDWILQRHETTAEPLLSLLTVAPLAFDLLFQPQAAGR